RHHSIAGELVHGPAVAPHHRHGAVQQFGHDLAQPLRPDGCRDVHRMNNIVTCLYSADRLTCVTGAPHSLQNFEFGDSSVPHDPHDSPDAVSAPRPSSTSVSCHRWSTM